MIWSVTLFFVSPITMECHAVLVRYGHGVLVRYGHAVLVRYDCDGVVCIRKKVTESVTFW